MSVLSIELNILELSNDIVVKELNTPFITENQEIDQRVGTNFLLIEKTKIFLLFSINVVIKIAVICSKLYNYPFNLILHNIINDQKNIKT